MGSHRLAIGVASLIVAVTLAGAGLWLAGAQEPPPDVTRAPPASPSVSVVRSGVPRHGDCGAYDGDMIERAACDDPRVNVEVGARRALGDPAAACPLYDRTTVLATPGGVGSLYVCWVPIGGGPARTQNTADLVEVTTSEPEHVIGVCGDVHEQHVHAPYACDDARVDGVVTATVIEAARCPARTLLAVPAATGRVVCWGLP